MTKEANVGFYDSQKSRKGDIIIVCERTIRIFREDIKLCKIYVHKDFCAEPEKIILARDKNPSVCTVYIL